ncbi:phosphoglycerol transferase [Alcanivorax hongdengensis A-11-3]|uniref:Phosphoglycerol transferase n=1 Tax=Alcanivorax hongdengensis A-11-3 TaxID=1177179 RepID=L0WCB5_9GAMM|nr:alkaline phosphatase family protein [Alcanivorax hongdengensis]EKF74596.1 phosphoglycerol transferase [Alcanivorax hongdengensis A-11-3]
MTETSPPRSLLTYLLGGFFALVLLTFLLRGFFLWSAHDVLHALSAREAVYAIFWGVRFDMAAAALPVTLITLVSYALVRVLGVRRLPLWPFALCAVLFVLAQVSDTIYFLEAGRHSGYEIWALFSEASGLAYTAVSDHGWLVLSAVLLSALIVWQTGARWMTVKVGFPATELGVVVMLVILVISVRGSIDERPMKPLRVFNVGNDEMAAVAENPNYTILYTLYAGNQLNAAYLDFPSLPAPLYRSTVKQTLIRENHSLVPPSHQYNVILFALEGWQSYFMNDTRQGVPVTPEFDKLAASGFSTDGLIAEGHRTVEGVFSLLCSYANPLGNAVVKNRLVDMHYECLSKILTDHGWNTAMFQGMHTGMVGDMTKKLGLTHSYGKNDIEQIRYPENGWGLDDNDLYHFILEKAESDSKPFFYVINTTSTHDGTLPEAVPYIFGDKTAEDRIESALHYADKALGDFVRALRKVVTRPTLLVITSDHTRGPLPDRFSNYHTPFAMLVLNGPSPQRQVPALASQRDVAPTILAWLGGHAPWFTGQSLWDLPAEDYRASYYTAGMYGWFHGDRVVEFPLARPDALSCFRWRHDEGALRNETCNGADKREQIRARAYMEYSQGLLFHGKTRDYGQAATLENRSR